MRIAALSSNHLRMLALTVLVCGAITGSIGAAAEPTFVDMRSLGAADGDPSGSARFIPVCRACHASIDGHSVVPEIPNLAGQPASYLYAQLLAYKSGERSHALMQSQVATMSDQDMRNMAAFFAAKTAPHGQSTGLEGPGSLLFAEGDATKGIPPCQPCHGVAGRGPRPDPGSATLQPPWSTFPAVAGQPLEYVLERLHAYRDGTGGGSTNARIMQSAVQNLDDEDMQAVARYISSL